MRRIALAIAGLGVLAACDIKRPTATIIEEIATTYFAQGPSGLVQTVVIEPPSADPEVEPVIGIHSVIKNTDKLKSVRVIFRSCTLLPEDIETSFGRMTAAEENDCTQFVDTLDLGPEASTPQVSGKFVANVSAGVHELTIRHSSSPAFVLEARFRKR